MGQYSDENRQRRVGCVAGPSIIRFANFLYNGRHVIIILWGFSLDKEAVGRQGDSGRPRHQAEGKQVILKTGFIWLVCVLQVVVVATLLNGERIRKRSRNVERCDPFLGLRGFVSCRG